MTTVAILPESRGTAGTTYPAVARNVQSTGRTAGEALDALTAQLGEEEAGTLVIVQLQRPDRFFSEQQQQRLEELMAHWRSARDADRALPPEEQTELEKLVGLMSSQRARSEIDRRYDRLFDR